MHRNLIDDNYVEENVVPDERELAKEAADHEVTALLQDMVLDSQDVQEFLEGLISVAAAAFTAAPVDDHGGQQQ